MHARFVDIKRTNVNFCCINLSSNDTKNVLKFGAIFVYRYLLLSSVFQFDGENILKIEGLRQKKTKINRNGEKVTMTFNTVEYVLLVRN